MLSATLILSLILFTQRSIIAAFPTSAPNTISTSTSIMGGGNEYPSEDPPPYEANEAEPASPLAGEASTNSPNRKPGPLSKIRGLFESRDRSHQAPLTPPAPIEDLDLRRRYIDTGSHSLTGQYSLYDLLSIHSSSGSININVRPEPHDKQHPVPARLIVEGRSGSMNINMAGYEIPERDYVVSIDSQSGSVRGSLVHGRQTTVMSRSGRINLDLSLSGANSTASSLNTRSESGRSEITVHNHGNLNFGTAGSGPSIKEMSSTHTVGSGGLVLRYPREWEGTIQGQTGSGGLRLHGADVEIVSRGPHSVYAKKGKGDSTLSFQTGSGSVDVYFQ
ncbi:hypothetical protein LTR15_011078 [Elasticomyces elasticus]|nr:hypothetical protein LTR15_011078 [Elasticomyces elasticus]